VTNEQVIEDLVGFGCAEACGNESDEASVDIPKRHGCIIIVYRTSSWELGPLDHLFSMYYKATSGHGYGEFSIE